MIACVSPLASKEVIEDTLSTLHFASRAKTIQNHARVNLQAGELAASSSLLAQYEAQLAQLREQLREGGGALAGSKHQTAKQETKHIFVSRGDGGGSDPHARRQT